MFLYSKRAPRMCECPSPMVHGVCRSLGKVTLTCWLKGASWGILDSTGTFPWGPSSHWWMDGQPARWTHPPSCWQGSFLRASHNFPCFQVPSFHQWLENLIFRRTENLSFKVWNKDFFLNLEIKYSDCSGLCSPDSYWLCVHTGVLLQADIAEGRLARGAPFRGIWIPGRPHTHALQCFTNCGLWPISGS